MDTLAIESFIDFCDEMEIGAANEGFKESAAYTGKKIVNAIKTALEKLLDFFKKLVVRLKGLRQVTVPKTMVTEVENMIRGLNTLAKKADQVSYKLKQLESFKARDAYAKFMASDYDDADLVTVKVSPNVVRAVNEAITQMTKMKAEIRKIETAEEFGEETNKKISYYRSQIQIYETMYGIGVKYLNSSKKSTDGQPMVKKNGKKMKDASDVPEGVSYAFNPNAKAADDQKPITM